MWAKGGKDLPLIGPLQKFSRELVFMVHDERDLLKVLKLELAFLECGGYRNGDRSWRPALIFEDSPTCLSFNDPKHTWPCGGCFLSQLAPREFRFEAAPCRHVSLNDQGETVDSFYRTGTQRECEAAVRSWLQDTIRRIEAFAVRKAVVARNHKDLLPEQ